MKCWKYLYDIVDIKKNVVPRLSKSCTVQNHTSLRQVSYQMPHSSLRGQFGKTAGTQCNFNGWNSKVQRIIVKTGGNDWTNRNSVMKEYYINDRRIPPCLIGTWTWGSGSNGSQMIFGKKYDTETLKETFNQAVENGFVFWDTAKVYGMGNSEKLLGSLIKDSKEKIIISTKYAPNKKKPERQDGRIPFK